MHIRNLATVRFATVLLFFDPSALFADKPKVWSQPLTVKSYQRIDVASVHPDGAPPDAVWLEKVRQINPMLAERISVDPVASLDITFRNKEEAGDSVALLSPLVEAGKERAAQFGGNVLYMDRYLTEEGQVAGLHFIVYRVQYDSLPVPPGLVADLPQKTLSDEVFEQEIQDWNDKHFGNMQMAFTPKNPNARPRDVVRFLGTVQNGTPVKVFLRNGTDYKGSYQGLDEDDQIWIRPEGWIGLITDRSFQAKDVDGVGIFN